MSYIVTLVILLNFIPAIFSYYGYKLTYLTLVDLQIMLACFSMYALCPMRNWGLKVLTFISAMVSVAVFIHNFLLSIGKIDEGLSAVYSVLFIIVLAAVLCIPFYRHWQRLPNDKIEPGNYYEIIGKPRTDLQFLLFMVTGGRGGSYAITDGVNMVKMSRSANMSIKKPLDYNYLNGKKCIMIGASGVSNKRTFNKKIGVKWSLWRTCYWLSQGFKNA